MRWVKVLWDVTTCFYAFSDIPKFPFAWEHTQVCSALKWYIFLYYYFIYRKS